MLKTSQHPLRLRMRNSQRQGEIIELPPKCSIGAAPNCTLSFREQGVHPLHCLILQGKQGAVVRRFDADTRLNGTFFTDARLLPGDRLHVGPLLFEVLGDADSEESTASRKTALLSDVLNLQLPEEQQHAQLRAAHQQSIKEVSALRARIAEYEQSESHFQTLETRLQGKIEALQREATELEESQVRELSRHAEEMAELKRRCSAIRDQQAESDREIATQQEEQQALLAENGRLAAELAESRRQLEKHRLQTNRKQQHEELMQCRRDLAALQQVHQRTQTNLTLAQNVQQQLREHQAALESRAESAAAADALQIKLKQTEEALAEAIRSKDGLEHRLDLSEKRWLEKEQSWTTDRQNFVTAQQELHVEIAGFKEQIESLHLQLKELRQQAEQQDVAEKEASWNAQRAEHEIARQELQVQLSASQEEVVSLKQTLEELCQQAEQQQESRLTERELAKWEEKLRRCEAVLEEQQEELQLQQNELQAEREKFDQERQLREEEPASQPGMNSRESEFISAEIIPAVEDPSPAREESADAGSAHFHDSEDYQEESQQIEGSACGSQIMEDRPADAGISADEVAFSTPSEEAPISTAEILSRLGSSWNQQEEEEEAFGPSLGAPSSNPIPAPSPANFEENFEAGYTVQLPHPVTPPKAEEEEDSIEDYMARLLQRVRGDQPAPAPAVHKPAAVATPQPKPQAAQQPKSNEPYEYVPRSAAPEKSSHLAAMRELSILSAKNALSSNDRRQQAGRARFRFMLSGAALAAMSSLVFTQPSLLVWGGFAANAAIASYFGLKARQTRLTAGSSQTQKRLKKTPQSEPADSAEDLPR